MPKYYKNKNAQYNGDHEVHAETCHRLPYPVNREYLGMFPSCHGAVKKALETDKSADGCYFCCPECHKS